jgi:sRNA-binding regulator protein Hfq
MNRSTPPLTCLTFPPVVFMDQIHIYRPGGRANHFSFRWPDLHTYRTRSSVVEAANRKLIRPSFTAVKEKMEVKKKILPPKKHVPPDQTNAENFYYVKQMQSKTPMVLVLADGEKLNGVIEWYDKGCLKFNRDEGPNLLVYKSCIKYMYKAE